MNDLRPVGVLVLAVLLVLSTGMAGVAVADDSPVPSALSALDSGEITVEEENGGTETEPEENETGDSFEVTDLDAPETVTAGESVAVTANISNPNEFETNQSVEFRLDGDVVDRQTVTIDAGENRTVSITLDAEEVGVGSYIHGFLTTDRGELAVLEVVPFAELEFDEQETDGETVVVDSVRLSEGGFVAIYDAEGKLIGVSEYLDAGDHDEIEIELTDELDDDADLTAGVHLADDDEEFDEDDRLEQPYVDTDGEPITDSATVIVPVEEDDSDVEEDAEEDESDTEDAEEDESDADDTDSVETVTPAVNFSDQESDGESVVVETAVLPGDGYVAVYEDDELIGVSEYLDADEHEEIDVDLFEVPDGEFERDHLTENTTLTAVLHEETSGNETFDHLRNESLDGPIVDDEDISVSDEADITVSTPETDTEDDENDVDEPATEDDEAEDDEAEDDEAEDADDADDTDEGEAADDAETEADEDEAGEDADEADDADTEAEDDEGDEDADSENGPETEAAEDESEDDADDQSEPEVDEPDTDEDTDDGTESDDEENGPADGNGEPDDVEDENEEVDESDDEDDSDDADDEDDGDDENDDNGDDDDE